MAARMTSAAMIEYVKDEKLQSGKSMRGEGSLHITSRLNTPKVKNRFS